MKRFFILITFPFSLFGQTIETVNKKVEFINQYLYPISISQNDTNFEDLVNLKKAIGNSSVVFLGEQSHGDGTTFEAKVRLVKFLHQEMGFDVLAFESGLYDCSKTWEAFKNHENPLFSAAKGVSGIWSLSQEVNPLFYYISEQLKNNTPLEISGFDCAYTGSVTNQFTLDLENNLQKINSSILKTKSWESFKLSVSKFADSDFPATPSKMELMQFDSTLKIIIAEFHNAPAQGANSENKLWDQLCQNLQGLRDMVWTYKGNFFFKFLLHGSDIVSIRDKQMTKNFFWLKNTYFKDKKIIVWAATSHLLRKATTGKYQPMGEMLSDSLRNEIYSIAFTAYQGKVADCGSISNYSIRLPKKGSIEDIFHRTGKENGFIDFKTLPQGNWLRQKNLARPLGYVEEKRNWPEFFDGLIYTQIMKRSTFKEVYSNGQVKEIWFYDGEQTMNKAEMYDSDGKKTKELYYLNGKRTGKKVF